MGPTRAALVSAHVIEKVKIVRSVRLLKELQHELTDGVCVSRPPGAECRMRIAQIGPLAESVPPARYGGTERVVSFLTEELVDLGHDVTLFASGDSITNAVLVSPCPRALRLSRSLRPDPNLAYAALLDQVMPSPVVSPSEGAVPYDRAWST
jgi:hypothetical protein